MEGVRRSPHKPRYAELVACSLHVSLDDASVAALAVLRAGGLTDSEAVRTALREAAARRRERSAIRQEVRRLSADEGDREEMRAVRERMAELASPARELSLGDRARGREPHVLVE